MYKPIVLLPDDFNVRLINPQSLWHAEYKKASVLILLPGVFSRGVFSSSRNNSLCPSPTPRNLSPSSRGPSPAPPSAPAPQVDGGHSTTLPLVLCNLLNREFSGAKSPVAGVSSIRSRIKHHRRGTTGAAAEDDLQQDEEAEG